MSELRLASERGIANYGWLFAQHTFSFGRYFDPRHTGFSDLLVLNDDVIQPKTGFDIHPHNNMEIFTYVLDGELSHEDSMDKSTVIKRGDVQMMSAGTGILHREFNGSNDASVHLLQIWLVPNRREVSPRYEQRCFPDAVKRGRLCLIISPDQDADSLPVYQDVRVYAGLFDGPEQQVIELPEKRFAYVHIAKGSVSVNGKTVNTGDGLKFRNVRNIEFAHGKDAEVLVFDLRPNELPNY